MRLPERGPPRLCARQLYMEAPMVRQISSALTYTWAIRSNEIISISIDIATHSCRTNNASGSASFAGLCRPRRSRPAMITVESFHLSHPEPQTFVAFEATLEEIPKDPRFPNARAVETAKLMTYFGWLSARSTTLFSR